MHVILKAKEHSKVRLVCQQFKVLYKIILRMDIMAKLGMGAGTHFFLLVLLFFLEMCAIF